MFFLPRLQSQFVTVMLCHAPEYMIIYPERGPKVAQAGLMGAVLRSVSVSR